MRRSAIKGSVMAIAPVIRPVDVTSGRIGVSVIRDTYCASPVRTTQETIHSQVRFKGSNQSIKVRKRNPLPDGEKNLDGRSR